MSIFEDSKEDELGKLLRSDSSSSARSYEEGRKEVGERAYG